MKQAIFFIVGQHIYNENTGSSLMHRHDFIIHIAGVISQAVSLFNRVDDDGDDNNNAYGSHNRYQSSTHQQLADIDELLSRIIGDESTSLSSGEVLYRNTRRQWRRSH
ncbi:unnamed protein product [Rotaria magnacalcarata]